MLALQQVDQARAPDHFGIQALGGQEHHREVGGVRRRDVLVADRLGLHAHRAFKLDALQAHTLGVSLFLRVQQALVVLARELGVDRQPHRRVVAAAARQAHGDIDHLATIRAHLHRTRVLLLGERLLEDVLQLHFTPAATVLDVGQHALEVADAGGQLLHFAEATLHLFQALRQHHQQRHHPVRGQAVALVGTQVFGAVEDFQVGQGLAQLAQQPGFVDLGQGPVDPFVVEDIHRFGRPFLVIG